MSRYERSLRLLAALLYGEVALVDGRFARFGAGPRARRRAYLRAPESLEKRKLLSVSFASDPSVAGRFIVHFAEDVPGTADQLTLHSSGGVLEYQWDGAPFTTDLDSSTAGVQSLSLGQISRIDVSLGAGDDMLTIDDTGGPIAPTPGGISYDGGPGNNQIGAIGDENFTLTDTRLTSSGGLQVALLSVGRGSLTGGNSPNRIDASLFSGPVTLNGGNGDDTLLGGAGNDLIDGGQGSESLSGGAGDDTIYGGNSGSTLDGGAGNDLLIGGNGKDFLYGGTGNDTLIAGNGDDYLDGGAGDDRLEGDLGNDTILGGPGIDTVVATADVSFTLTNTSMTGQGTDVLSGVEQAILTGGPSANTINASAFSGRATLDGGGGNDLLLGSQGGTTFIRSLGQLGNPTLHGGAGDDLYRLVPGGVITLIDDGGNDTLDFTQSDVPVTIDLTQSSGSPQVVDSRGDAVAVNGQIENVDASNLGDRVRAGNTASLIFGGTGSDSIVGGSGNCTLISGGGNDIIFGGTGSDSIIGGSGNSTLVSGGGNDIIYGGTGSDSIVGGSGNSTLLSGGGNDIIYGGTGSDSIVGGSGNSTLVSGGGNDLIYGGTGTDSIVGGSGNCTLVSGGGNDVIYGGTGSDSIVGGSGNCTLSGGGGNDIIFGGSGSSLIDGGDGNDLIYGGTGSDFITGGLGDDVIYGGTGDDTIDGGPGNDLLYGGTGSTQDPGGNDSIVGGTGDDTLVAAQGNDTLVGGAGNDTYDFSGNGLGSDVVVEADNADVDTLDFSTFAGPISIDLAQTSPQVVNPGNLTLTLTSATGIEDVIGSAYADTILGNARDNGLRGADTLVDPTGTPGVWDGRTQEVFLDFDSKTDPGEHVYTPAERDAVQARIAAAYAPFHYDIRQSAPASGPYVTVYFNDTPIINGVPQPGGISSALDFRNLDLGGVSHIDVNGFLGGFGQPAATSANYVAISATIAAHELGHLVGLEHGDAFGPIGYGIHNPPGNGGYIPAYPGPAGAFETDWHMMASPASVGSSLFDAVNTPFFDEREAVKLSFDDHGTTVPEQAALHGSLSTTGPTAAQPLSLVPLTVPNTLVRGINALKDFAVAALDVTGFIGIDPSTGHSESDVYSFSGTAGELLNIQVMSAALTRITNPIDGILKLYDALGNLVSDYGGTATNDNDFETEDPSLVDVRLPSNGTYYIEVDTFNPPGGSDTDTGNYELFLYSFAAGNRTDQGDRLVGRAGNDTLDGGLGNDTLDGGLGNNTLNGGLGDDVFTGFIGGADTIQDAGGTDTLDFSSAPQGVTIDIGLGAGQVQTLDAAGDTLAITGTIENVIGSPFADRILGNSANNDLFGGAGDDTITGGLGSDTIDGGSGNDRVVETRDADMILADGSLQIGAEGIDTLIGIEQAALTGGAGDNTFDVSGWSGSATLDGGAGNDRVVSANDADFTLTDTSLTRSTGGSFVLASVERAALTGGASDNSFNVSGWSGSATLDGGAGNDRIISSNDADFTLSDTSLTRSTGGSFALTSIERAVLTGGAGNNVLNAAAFSGRVTLSGGAGNDTLTGGSGPGVLIGGDGNDVLTGGAGRDLLIGGNGADQLSGGGDDDILIGGSTTFDQNLSALDAILAEWTSSDTYSDRIAYLSGTRTGGLNGSVVLIKGVTVFDDSKAPDTLTGGLGTDWFIVFNPDKVTDKVKGEIVT